MKPGRNTFSPLCKLNLKYKSSKVRIFEISLELRHVYLEMGCRENVQFSEKFELLSYQNSTVQTFLKIIHGSWEFNKVSGSGRHPKDGEKSQLSNFVFRSYYPGGFFFLQTMKDPRNKVKNHARFSF